jgi:hypothetical protein
MTTIFTLTNDPDPIDSINLDDLYEKRKEENLETVRLYNRILSKIHDRIKYISRQRNVDQICWYVIPEIILGVPKYNHRECVNYILEKLKGNGFRVRYIHPNLVCVSWAHYVPNYVRTEIQKKTGLTVDHEGKEVRNNDDDEDEFGDESRQGEKERAFFQKPRVRFNLKRGKRGKNEPIETTEYKPTGKMVYADSVVESLQTRLSRK